MSNNTSPNDSQFKPYKAPPGNPSIHTYYSSTNVNGSQFTPYVTSDGLPLEHINTTINLDASRKKLALQTISYQSPGHQDHSILLDPSIATKLIRIDPNFISTNVSGDTVLAKLTGAAALSAASGLGVPQISQITQAVIGDSYSTYSTLPLNQLKPFPGVLLSDFRSRRILSGTIANSINIRLDGTAAAIGGRSKRAVVYAAAAASPAGAYAIFNLNGVGKTGFGWGDHGNPYALRSDFTSRSHITQQWDAKENGGNGAWTKTKNLLEKLTPFRGDRVSVIDYGKRSYAEAYQWNPSTYGGTGAVGTALSKAGITQDFIKFFMTGPKLFNGAADSVTDDIIVFRASINSISDSFSANWTPANMIGRADPNYHYTGFSRDLSLDFTVYATDRDEVRPIWRKLNALAGITAPTYKADNIAMQAPWMRLTLGDLFVQQPVFLTSLSYTLHDTDTTWEINIEDDMDMMQVPHKVTVSCAFTVVGDALPQRNGKFYTLAKEFDSSGSATLGSNNWLSDMQDNSDILSAREQRKLVGTESGKEVVGGSTTK
jgi:hypothetical protein